MPRNTKLRRQMLLRSAQPVGLGDRTDGIEVPSVTKMGYFPFFVQPAGEEKSGEPVPGRRRRGGARRFAAG
jgi:hypothetical protein